MWWMLPFLSSSCLHFYNSLLSLKDVYLFFLWLLFFYFLFLASVIGVTPKCHLGSQMISAGDRSNGVLAFLFPCVIPSFACILSSCWLHKALRNLVFLTIIRLQIV